MTKQQLADIRCFPTHLSRICALSLLFLTASSLIAQIQPEDSGKKSHATAAVTKNGSAAETENANGSDGKVLSEAERIAQLSRAIERNKKLKSELQAKVDAPDSEYVKANETFLQLDKELEEKKKQLKKLKEEGETESAAELAKEIEALTVRHSLAKERFELALKEHKARQQQIETLTKSIEQDQKTLTQLQSPATAPAPDLAPAPPSATAPTEASAPQSPTAEAPAGAPVATPTDVPAQPAAPPVAPADEPVDEEELEARKEVEQKQAKAQEAKKTVLTFKEEIERLEAQIATERELLETERQKRQTALKTERTLTEQLNKLKAENAAPQQQKEIQAEIDAAKALAATAETEIETHQDNIEGMEEALQLLREQQAAAEKEAQAAEEEAEEAQSALERLLSPFALDNIINWLVAHGPTLLGIIIGTFIALWLVGRLDHRLVGMLTSRSDRGSEAHRENRAQTLVAVFHNAGHIIVIITAILLTLGELGVSTASLMGGVAVFGLAIGFGAQNLIRDFFYGFMILLENQYTINDVVKIGDHAGLVERITLRVTVLRDLEGIVHFIPNGEVTSVRNLTHGWSRVVLDIGVAYKEDVDQVMEVLTEVAEEVCENPLYKHLIIADPEMLGVDAFGDSAVVIKMLLKTRPLQQWTVKRAMLYHIKKRFDKLGIEIPFPHRTVYMRAETHAPPEAELPPSTLSSQEN